MTFQILTASQLWKFKNLTTCKKLHQL